MCKVLKLPSSTYYYESKESLCNSEITTNILEIFRISRNNYGTRKIKVELSKLSS